MAPFADLTSDFRFALRMLRKAPLTSVMIVAFLGFSVGAVGTVFAWTELIVLKPLPAVSGIDDIASLRNITAHDDDLLSYQAFLDLRAADSAAASPSFSDLTGFAIRRFSMRIDPRAEARLAEPVWGALVSANYFDLLRVRPAMGPGLRPGDDRVRGGRPVAVISHSLWQRRFVAAPDIVGRRLTINNRELEIVGVAPESFGGTIARIGLDIWIPVTMQTEIGGSRDLLDRRDLHWFDAFGRLRTGVTVEAARERVSVIGKSLSSRHAADRDYGMIATTFDVGPVQRMAPLLAVMLGISVLVVLIVCSNVANLLLLRGAAREHEIAVRIALGAQPDRVVRQLLTESLLLAVGGVAMGMVTLAISRNSLASLSPASPLPILTDTPVDWLVVTVLAITGVATTFVFGLAPALRATRIAVRSALGGSGSARGSSSGTGRLRGALVGAQFALSLAVLVIAALFLRRLDELERVDRGFRDPEQVLLTTIDFDLAGVSGDSIRHSLTERLVDRVAAMPGVEHATAATFVPLGFLGYSSADVKVDGYVPARGESMNFLLNAVGADYFETMGIPILLGRGIGRGDRAGTQPVAVVNAAFAARFFGAANPVGRRIQVRQWEFVVAGVAENGKYAYLTPLDEPSPPFVYVPLQQWGVGTVVIHARTAGDALALTSSVQRAAATTDARLLAIAPSTLEAYSTVPYLPVRLASRILSVLGTGALILATLGLYAVIGFAVEQRKREIGIRMALGASPRRLVLHFVAHAAKFAGPGAVLGVVLAIAMSLTMSARLPGSMPRVANAMIVPFVLATLTLVVVAAIAALVPAARAARVDPTVALREE